MREMIANILNQLHTLFTGLATASMNAFRKLMNRIQQLTMSMFATLQQSFAYVSTPLMQASHVLRAIKYLFASTLRSWYFGLYQGLRSLNNGLMASVDVILSLAWGILSIAYNAPKNFILSTFNFTALLLQNSVRMIVGKIRHTANRMRGLLYRTHYMLSAVSGSILTFPRTIISSVANAVHHVITMSGSILTLPRTVFNAVFNAVHAAATMVMHAAHWITGISYALVIDMPLNLVINMSKMLSSSLQMVSSSVMPFTSSLISNISWLGHAIAQKFSQSIQVIWTTITFIIQTITHAVMAVVQNIHHAFANLFHGLYHFVLLMAEYSMTLAHAMMYVPNMLYQALLQLTASLQSMLSKVFDATAQIAALPAQAAHAGLAGAHGAISSPALVNMVNGVKRFFNYAIKDPILMIIREIITTCVALITLVKNSFLSLINGIINGFANLANVARQTKSVLRIFDHFIRNVSAFFVDTIVHIFNVIVTTPGIIFRHLLHEMEEIYLLLQRAGATMWQSVIAFIGLSEHAFNGIQRMVMSVLLIPFRAYQGFKNAIVLAHEETHMSALRGLRRFVDRLNMFEKNIRDSMYSLLEWKNQQHQALEKITLLFFSALFGGLILMTLMTAQHQNCHLSSAQDTTMVAPYAPRIMTSCTVNSVTLNKFSSTALVDAIITCQFDLGAESLDTIDNMTIAEAPGAQISRINIAQDDQRMIAKYSLRGTFNLDKNAMTHYPLAKNDLTATVINKAASSTEIVYVADANGTTSITTAQTPQPASFTVIMPLPSMNIISAMTMYLLVLAFCIGLLMCLMITKLWYATLASFGITCSMAIFWQLMFWLTNSTTTHVGETLAVGIILGTIITIMNAYLLSMYGNPVRRKLRWVLISAAIMLMNLCYLLLV